MTVYSSGAQARIGVVRNLFAQGVYPETLPQDTSPWVGQGLRIFQGGSQELTSELLEEIDRRQNTRGGSPEIR